METKIETIKRFSNILWENINEELSHYIIDDDGQLHKQPKFSNHSFRTIQCGNVEVLFTNQQI